MNPRSLENYEPVFRGRKLVLNYTGGSLCPSSSNRRSPHAALDLSAREIIDDDDDDKDKDKDKNKDKDGKDDDEDPPKKKPSSDGKRRKTAIISLLCESDPLAKTAFSFVAAVDECVYFFEGRSAAACGGVHIEEQALGPSGVFGVIALIAVLVYFVGGCVYQRTVMHQRGWRQLPNYAMWAGIARFFTVTPPRPSVT
jgi:cation-dependent mannose-6-phosphate receptor